MATVKKSNDAERTARDVNGARKAGPAGSAGKRKRKDEDEAKAPEMTYRELHTQNVAALFRAAGGLYRAAPWKWVPDDESLFSVTSEQLGLQGAALFLMGQQGESYGFMLFSSADDFEEYLNAVEQIDRGEAAEAPRHIALTLENRSAISTALRKDITEQRWEVAAPDAVPMLVAVDERLVFNPPSAEDLAIAEAVTLALPEFFKDKDAFLTAWQDDASVERTVTVAARAGEIQVTLRAPHEVLEEGSQGDDLLGELQALEEAEEIDDAERHSIEDELMQLFLESPEGEKVEEVNFYGAILDFAASRFGVTVASIEPTELAELIFDVLPLEVDMEASDARSVIEECRAFYTFLKREFELEQADECLALLGPSAVAQLEAKISDAAASPDAGARGPSPADREANKKLN